MRNATAMIKALFSTSLDRIDHTIPLVLQVSDFIICTKP